MRRIDRGTSGPKPKPIANRNTAGKSKVAAQLANYHRSQGSRGHGGAAQVLTPRGSKKPHADYPTARPLKKPPGLHPAEIGHYLDTLGKYTIGGGFSPPSHFPGNALGAVGIHTRLPQDKPQKISVHAHGKTYTGDFTMGMLPWFSRVGTVRPAAWDQGGGGIPKGPGMPKHNADLQRLAEKEAAGPTPQEKVVEGLKKGHAQGEYRKQKIARHEELKRRVQSAEQALAEGTGEEAFRAAKRELKGKLPKGQFHGLRHLTDDEMDKLRERVQHHPDLTFFEKNTAWDAVRNAHLHGDVPAPHEYKILVKAFGPELVAREFSPSALSKYKHMLIETANIPRAVMSSFDISAPGRQGLVGLMRHPLVSGKELGPMLRSLKSEDYYHSWRQELEAHPNYELAERSGLALTDVEHTLANREEPFQSNYAERIPVVGHAVRGSGRAYNRFLVGQRFAIFNHLTDYAEKHGHELGEKGLKDLAGYINSATGRGDLGRFERSAVGLNSIFFSPRLIASRLDFLRPDKYMHLDPFVRRQKLRAAFQTAAAVSTLLYLGSRVAGVKVGVDPRSSDFGKMRIGNTRIDIGGGFNQYIRLAAQLASGEVKDTNTGELKHGEGWNAFGRFARAKLSPTTSLLTDLATRTDYAGRKIDTKNEIVSRVTPLVLQDAYAVLHQTDSVPAALGAYAAGATGIGVQSYGPQKATGAAQKDLRSDLRDNVRKYFGRGLTPRLKEALHLRETREQWFEKVLPKRPGRGASDEEKKTYALHRFNAQVDLLVKLKRINRAQARKAKGWARGQDYHKVNSETGRVGRKYFGGDALSDAAKKIRERGGHLYLSDY